MMKQSLQAMILTIGLALTSVGATPSFAQSSDETLADIRQELEFLYGDILRLKRELSTTGNSGLQSNNDPALQRLDSLETEVRRITGMLEEKQFWINNIVNDGTNRIGDLEFRLCELEDGCDAFSLDKTTPLGGKSAQRTGDGTGTTVPTTDTSGATDSEQANFERAYAAFEAGEYASAASQFESFALAFPGGPLTGEAHYWRAESLIGAGDTSNAALAFLESFSGSPQGTKAPNALFRLGVSLNELGQSEEACLMLSEVGVRYPTSAILVDAQDKYAQLGCS